MLKSMTGFGLGDYENENYRIHVEVKSVNNRYRDILCHMPKVLNCLEDSIKKQIGSVISRGKVDLFISFEEKNGGDKKIRVDKKLAISYHKALNEISDLLRLPRPDKVQQIAEYPDVLIVEEAPFDVENFRQPVFHTLAEALEAIGVMRAAEGSHILQDLQSRLQKLQDLSIKIEGLAPGVVAEYKLRLRQFLETEIKEIDETRIIQETSVFADKINFTEEIVRLRSHFKQFAHALQEQEPVGRKLDFLVQEMNRETNTIASKANAAEIAHLVVDMKSEIEKIREQVQNIE